MSKSFNNDINNNNSNNNTLNKSSKMLFENYTMSSIPPLSSTKNVNTTTTKTTEQQQEQQKNDNEGNINERLFIGDPLIEDIRLKQQVKDHDITLVESNLYTIEQELQALQFKRNKLIAGLSTMKQERLHLDKTMDNCKSNILQKWYTLSLKNGLQPTLLTTTTTDDLEKSSEEVMTTTTTITTTTMATNDIIFDELPSISTILPTELLLNILEYLSFNDINFSVTRVCKLWHHISFSDSIWKNLFHIRWNTLDIHHQNESKPLKAIPSSFWGSTPILPPSQAPQSFILPNRNNSVGGSVNGNIAYDGRNVNRKTPQSAIFPPATRSNRNQHNNHHPDAVDNTAVSCEVFNSHLSNSVSDDDMVLEDDEESSCSFASSFCSSTSYNPNKFIKRMRIDWRELYLKRQKIEHNWWNNICKPKKFIGHEDWVTCMQFDGKMLVTGSWDASLKLWNIETGECLVLSSADMPSGHTAGITCIQFRGTKLISGSSDSTLRIWDLTTGECLHVLRGHTDGVSCLTIIDDNTIVSGSLDNTINLWSIESGRLLHSFTNHISSITCLYYNNKNNLLISGTVGGTLNVIDLPSRIVLQTLHGHSDRVTSIQWWDGPDGERIISSSWDYTLRVWNIQTGKAVHVLSGHSFRVRCTHVRGDILVSGSWDTTVRVWDLITGKCIHTLHGHSFNVWGVQFEGRRLVTASWDQKVKVWDLETGKLLYTLDGHSDSIICLQFKGSKLVTAAKEIIVYDFDV